MRREIEDGWHKGNLMVVDEIYATNFVDHSPFPGITPNREGIKRFIKIIRDAFPMRGFCFVLLAGLEEAIWQELWGEVQTTF